MYFSDEVEDDFYLLGIPIPRFLVSIYIYLLDEGSDNFCIQFLDILTSYRQRKMFVFYPFKEIIFFCPNSGLRSYPSK
jgi:hypothetical protein